VCGAALCQISSACTLVCLVLIIDDAQKDVDKKIIMEFTFVQPVMSVRLRMDRCVYYLVHTHAHTLYVTVRYCRPVQVQCHLPYQCEYHCHFL